MIINMKKTCAKCRKKKNIKHFGKDSSRRDGLDKYCRPCRAKIYEGRKEKDGARRRVYYAENRESVLERGRQWNRSNQEWVRKWRKEYYQKRRDFAIQYSTKWVKEHPDKYKEYSKTYRNKSHAKIKRAENEQRRRARKKKSYIEPVDREAIIRRDGHICQICGRGPLGGDLVIDHIIPLARGGPHITSNLQVACRQCNAHKGSK